MGNFIIFLVIVGVIAYNVYRVTAELNRRARAGNPDAPREDALRQELERRLREDLDRMKPPPRPNARGGVPTQMPPPAPSQYSARPQEPKPIPPAPPPLRAQPLPSPAPYATPQPGPQPVRARQAPAAATPLRTTARPPKARRRAAAKIRPESLNPAMMRKVAILSEIYNPPLALREPRRP